MPNCRFLIGDGLLGREISHIQIPLLGHAIAIGVGFREVIAGVEEQHGNIRQTLAQQVEHDHVFGLKAAGDADGFVFAAAVFSRAGDRSRRRRKAFRILRRGWAAGSWLLLVRIGIGVAPFAQNFHDALDGFFVGVVGDAHGEK